MIEGAEQLLFQDSLCIILYIEGAEQLLFGDSSYSTYDIGPTSPSKSWLPWKCKHQSFDVFFRSWSSGSFDRCAIETSLGSSCIIIVTKSLLVLHDRWNDRPRKSITSSEQDETVLAGTRSSGGPSLLLSYSFWVLPTLELRCCGWSLFFLPSHCYRLSIASSYTRISNTVSQENS